MIKNSLPRVAFAGFGEINTPKEILVKKCGEALENLKAAGVDVVKAVYPITDDPAGVDVNNAIKEFGECYAQYDAVIVCVAGWIPTHAVVKVTETLRDLPMLLWGLCGWYDEDGHLVTTADQAGTTALRATFKELGYNFRYQYDIIGLPSKTKEAERFARAAMAKKKLRSSVVGMAGYRDMNLYGTLYDGSSLKRVTGVEIETFELLEMKQLRDKVTADEINAVIDGPMAQWKFTAPAERAAMEDAAGYYLAAKQIIERRGYESISLKDVDGMKALLGFPPAPIFMLISDELGVSTVPENDSLGCVTQLMLRYLTGQCAVYLEFYEFFEDRVLAGVPDFVPKEVTMGDTTVMPAAFGELSQGILNVSKVKTGEITMCRLAFTDGKYVMHMVKGNGITPRSWEEAGWTKPAPQLPGLEVLLDDVEDFADKVMAQHYFVTYGDNTAAIKELCKMLGIEVI
nr:hypothetical protein [Clostridia bacterium]